MFGIRIDYDKRIFGYDLLRAFAIFCVVHGHGRRLLIGTILEGFPWFSLPHGVDIFFVLSGFLIGFSFIVNINKTDGSLGFKKTLNFWKRSALRILPNYYLFLALNYILVNAEILPGTTDTFSIGLFITFTQNLFYPFYDFFWESWSLPVQEWFYLLFPLLLMVYTRFFSVKSGIIILSFLFLAISIFYRYSISHIEYDSFWWDVNYRKVVASRIDSIFFGVIAAWIRYYLPKIWNRYAIHALIAGIVLFVVMKSIPKTPNTLYLKLFYLSFSPFCIMLFFPIIDKLKNVRTVIGKVISHISILSYGMYLFNLL
ncbi:MAG: acyltransferase, partial [Candidatus Heimdallarchaeota archaeon]|nr:acyltransferase [Candidatus Heimdallarchaeota archaeon]